MAIGGYNPPVTYVTAVEFYDGGSWSTNPVTGPSIYGGAGSGTQAAAWVAGRAAVSPAPVNKLTYEWDGSAWTAGGSYVMTAVANIFGGGPTTTAWVSGGDADHLSRTLPAEVALRDDFGGRPGGSSDPTRSAHQRHSRRPPRPGPFNTFRCQVRPWGRVRVASPSPPTGLGQRPQPGDHFDRAASTRSPAARSVASDCAGAGPANKRTSTTNRTHRVTAKSPSGMDITP